MERRIMTMELVRPAIEFLPEYKAALERGWSPDNVREAEAISEELEQIATDSAAFVAALDDREARGGPFTLPDGSTVPRLPGFYRWLWDGAFCGSINIRWQPGTSALPPHVLGHIGYAVVPWKRGRGYATLALALMLIEARCTGLPFVEVTTDVDNVPSQAVVRANGGRLVERFRKPAALGGKESLRFRIDLRNESSSIAAPVPHGTIGAAESPFRTEGRIVPVIPKITMTDAPTPQMREAIRDPLVEFNHSRIGKPEISRPLAILLSHPESDDIIGGLYGSTFFSHLWVDLLFVPESMRGAGIGRKLMAEAEAVRRGCRAAVLDTFSFQARGFYERLGYCVFGRLDDCPPGHSRFYLTKRLAEAMPPIELRPAQAADFAFCRRIEYDTMRWIIEQLSGLDEAQHFEKFAKKWTVDEVRIITVDAKDAGWLQTAPLDDAICLRQIYLDRPFQRQGIGTRVMQLVMEEARSQSKAVSLGVVKINPARRLYERLGFRTTHEDEHKFYMRREADATS
jgi:predicted acetyltransferase/GNAT superfamily N-acetyltransferase